MKNKILLTLSIFLLAVFPAPTFGDLPIDYYQLIKEFEEANFNGDYHEAIELGARILPILKAAGDFETDKTAEVLKKVGLAYSFNGDLTSAERIFQDLNRICTSNTYEGIPCEFDAKLQLGQLYMSKDEDIKARSSFESIIENESSITHSKVFILAQAHYWLGIVYQKSNELLVSERELIKARDLFVLYGGEKSSFSFDATYALGWIKAMQGKFEESDKYYGDAIEIGFSVFGSDINLKMARLYSDYARMHLWNNDSRSAMKYVNKSIPLKKRLNDNNIYQLAVDYYILGTAYYQQEMWQETIIAFSKLQDILEFESLNDSQKLDYFKTLGMRGHAETLLGEHEPGIQHLIQALKGYYGIKGAHDLITIGFLKFLATSFYLQGDVVETEKYVKQYASVSGEYFGPASSFALEAMGLLADFYYLSEKFSEAEDVLDKLLNNALDNNSLEPDFIKKYYDQLMFVYSLSGKFEEEVELHLQAYAFASSHWGENNIETQAYKVNLAARYSEIGKNFLAEKYFLEALEVLSQLSANDNIEGIARRGLGLLYLDIGDNEAAIKQLIEARRIFAQNDGEGSRDVILLDTLLIMRTYKEGKSEIAEKKLGELKGRITRLYGAGSHEYSVVLLLQFAFLEREGKYARAEALLKEVINTLTQLFDSNPYPYQYDLLLARTVQYQGRFKAAEVIFSKLYDRVAKQKGDDSYEATEVLYYKTLLDIARDADDILIENQYSKIFAAGIGIIQNTLGLSSDRQKLLFMKKVQGVFHSYLLHVSRHHSGDSDKIINAYNVHYRRKSSAIKSMTNSYHSLNESSSKLLDELRWKKIALSKIETNKAFGLNDESILQLKDKYESDVLYLEKQVAFELKQDIPGHTNKYNHFKEVANNLNEDEVILDFVKVHDFDLSSGKYNKGYKYLCFIIEKGIEPVIYEYKSGKDFEGLVTKLSQSMQNMNKDSWRHAATQLYELLFEPIETHIEEGDSLVIIADGIINQVPFAALIDKGLFLVEKCNIKYLNSSEEVYKENIQSERNVAPVGEKSSAVIVANPDYGTSLIAKDETSGKHIVFRSTKESREFEALPGTAREALNVAAIIGSSARIIAQTNANEGAVTKIVSPSILHFATHAFFMAEEQQDEIETFQLGPLETFNVPGNPFSRSGIALAGANQAFEVSDSEDGLLTAQEIMLMDLSNTQLVTLSACDTAKGDIISGEGVFGLRLAFSLAGAHYIVMSLWKVSDEVTADHMSEFYRYYKESADPSGSLRKAQITMINQLRGKYGQAPPVLWAAFIAQGY